MGKDVIEKALLARRGGTLPVKEIPIRVAGFELRIYMDLGDEAGRVIEIGNETARLLPSESRRVRPARLSPTSS